MTSLKNLLMYLATLFLNCNPCFILCQTYDGVSLRPNSWCAKVHFGLLYPCKQHCECYCYFSLTITIPHKNHQLLTFYYCHHPSYQMHLIKNNCLQITTGNLEILLHLNNQNLHWVQIKHSTWGNECCHILSLN